ncbi:MAG: PepSY-associated TM helix domain-containing protein [Nitrospira sp.]
MKESFTQSMDWLHTWGGLLFGWILFAIFLTGTLTVFDKDITYWMQPELHHLDSSPPDLDAAGRQLAHLAPEATQWWITLPSTREPVASIGWQGNDERTSGERKLDPATGKILDVRETRGGDFFYRFHYSLHLDRAGIWIVGASAMVMLVALISGLVIHHRIFKDFFSFRPRATSHRAWLDAHNLTSVLVLPFHLVITFTGLVIFWNVYMPVGIDLMYGGNFEKGFNELEERLERESAQSPAALASLNDMERQAHTQWSGGSTEWIQITHPGDRHALVNVSRRADDRLALISDRVTFDGATGERLQVWKGELPAFTTYSVLIGLHYLWFDHDGIRWLYFGMSLAATVMIATGLLLWIIKRRDRHAGHHIGYRIVESLNVAVVAGLMVATAVFFLANRLLPVALSDRAGWEMGAFFLAWGLCATHSFVRMHSRQAWQEQLYLSALLFVSIPLCNMATTHSHLLVTMSVGKWRLAAVDLTCLIAGLLLGWAAWRMKHGEQIEHPSTNSLTGSAQA